MTRVDHDTFHLQIRTEWKNVEFFVGVMKIHQKTTQPLHKQRDEECLLSTQRDTMASKIQSTHPASR